VETSRDWDKSQPATRSFTEHKKWSILA